MKMSMVRWTPMSEWRALGKEMDRLFESVWRGDTEDAGLQTVAAWRPGADVRETPEEFLLRLDLPGVNQKDVKVSLYGDTLRVSGERHEDTEEKDVTWHRVERIRGQFERAFRLGSAVAGDKVSATFKDGVLEIRVPKAESARPREIPVRVESK
jgi:HSP20 family protein